MSAHDVDDEKKKKKSLSRARLEREIWARHRMNVQRLEKSHPLGLAALTTNFVNNDMNDVAVLQSDDRLTIPQTLFDLNGASVQFTPSGSGYTFTSAPGAFDTNLGTKLDLTAPPAVNPNPGAESGDDAYIMQNLGFNFSLFGSSYTEVAVSSNGNLTFRPAGVSDTDFALGAISPIESYDELEFGLPRIGPYWHDLLATTDETPGARGIYIRRDSGRVLITWNDIRDFPLAGISGVHRFQVSLFNDGRIVFTYATAELTSTALAGITPGLTGTLTTAVDLSNPSAGTISGPIGEFFTFASMTDYIAVIRAFYATHPGNDTYDFVYLMSDFDLNLGDAFAFYLAVRNDTQGLGLNLFDQDPGGFILGAQKIQGFLNLSNIKDNYPASPTTRLFGGANHALSVMGQEQGHRWLAFPFYPGSAGDILLGRDLAHWSFFFNIESTTSTAAARRSSSAEGNVWRNNGNGTFTTVNLIDGYSRLDQYLMGLRPPNQVPDTFVIANPFNTTPARARASNPFPNVTTSGTRVNVTIGQIIDATGPRVPDSTTSQKSFRAAVVLLVQQGTQPSAETLNKVTRYRLAWESYFAQSTDNLASITTSLTDPPTPRAIFLTSAAAYTPTLVPAEIGTIFGFGMTDGRTESASGRPLPTALAGIQVRVDGVLCPLFYASPGQINFQVPGSTTSVTTTPPVSSATSLVEVLSNGEVVAIRGGAFQIAPTAPTIFTVNSSGGGPASAIDAFTSAPAPFNARQANGQPNIISVFGTGLGADATDGGGNVSGSSQAFIDGVPVTLSYAGQAPGFTGLNQFNVVFPANITSGTHTLIVARNGIQSNLVTVAVR